MKTTIIALIATLLSIGLISCGGKNSNQEGENRAKWSKPHGVLEGCDGVMSNSQQCENNPNNKQYMIEINRINGE
ncbi:hypothetical protein PT276_02335 [Orbaceae bacterium ESL0721]|nr:hypothetical protein [Orbaceae bacterium ESL0721]